MGKSHLGILYLLLFVVSFVLYVQSQSTPDLSSMQALKSTLTLTKAYDWSDPDPCKWTKVRCDGNNRINRIQLVGSEGNKIQGTLPADLRNLSSLIILELMGNQLSGPLPSLAGLKALQEINIHNNNFSSIPSDFFSDMSSLQTVNLDYNPFSPWEIPDNLRDATSLQEFSANGCNIFGKIPEFFNSQTFPGLTKLHLAMNKLQGQLPTGFAGSMIQSLWVNGQAGNTKLNGSIAILQSMTSLTEVWLHMNQFSGPIPDLSGLTSMRNFSVRDNQLTGIVPLSLVNLPSLYIVNLTNNLLQGPTPSFDTKSVNVDMKPGSNSFCLDTPGVDCDSQVNTLLSIVESMGYPISFAQNWKGNNPCTPWMGVSCTGKEITVINFKNMGLSGTISPKLANLTSLQIINLSGNNLNGTIPTELTALPKLTNIDVSKNRIYGKVPNFRQNVVVNTEGNPDIGKDGPTPASPSGGSPGSKGHSGGSDSSGSGDKKSNTGKVVGSIVGGLGGLCLVGLGICLYARRGKRTSRVQSPHTVVIHPRHSGESDAVKITVAGSSATGASETYSHTSSGPSDIHVVEAGNMVISIQVLRNVTNNFSEENVLGRGGFGTVYKGELHDGTKIAVKRMESGVVSEKGLAEFMSEIAVLTKVRHRHLVALLGYCLDGNERLLVYEYMPQGTLSRHLFNWKEENLKPLEWTRRLTIALDVARGVEYLHGLAHQSFIHRDLKPSNILLGDDMRAKVADFGLVRLAPDGKHSIETRLAGTFGYLAPEYAGNLSFDYPVLI